MAQRRLVVAALREQEQAVSRAYIDAVKNKKINIGELESKIANGDLFEDDLLLTDAELAPVIETLRTATIAGASLEGAAFFNANASAVTDYLQSAARKFLDDMNDSTRAAVREVTAVGVQLGQNPRSIALDLAGRMEGRERVGGIIGLNAPQAQAVANARLNLASGNPEQMRKYLRNERRDKRFDGIVERAIAEGKPVATADIDKIVSRYQSSLLKLRGETIARTEAGAALNFGRQTHAENIAAETGAEVWKRWESGPDDGLQRESHTEANGQEVRIDKPFIVGGFELQFPGDYSLGADAGEVINCRCSVSYEIREKEQQEAA